MALNGRRHGGVEQKIHGGSEQQR
ncbi:uncharacterized protein G2W53_003518 [Senna tora]|uniref:Uncharacterized protein n=1 Tax=Senna tora TaxID=362788 RepID=A0A834XAQ9_9FABA|nr:uncharacterized protein G2W53_003518 [Senna tora]